MEATEYQLYVFDKIKEDAKRINPILDINTDVQPIIKRIDVRTRLIRQHIPTELHNSFLNDLETLGFIKSKDKLNIELLKWP